LAFSPSTVCVLPPDALQAGLLAALA
jgi:hypothetical protein